MNPRNQCQVNFIDTCSNNILSFVDSVLAIVILRALRQLSHVSVRSFKTNDYNFFARDVIGDTREVGRTTIFFDAVIVMLALEMTAALMADVLVHRSRVSHVKNVTMTHVASSQDIARSL